jgi:hypothetical protein
MLKVVLHKSYGGFHLTNEIVHELDNLRFDWNRFGDRPEEFSENFIYTDYMDDFAFRSAPTFVLAIENLKKKLDDQNLSVQEIRTNYLYNLKIVEFNPKFEIVDKHDGIETLYCNGREVY